MAKNYKMKKLFMGGSNKSRKRAFRDALIKTTLFFLLLSASSFVFSKEKEVPPAPDDATSSLDTYGSEQDDILAEEIKEEEGDKEAAETPEEEPEEKIPKVNEKGIPHKDIGIFGLEEEETEKFHRQYTSEHGRKLLILSLENSVPYRPYIIEKLKEFDMPMYLQYLPIVESNYVPGAVSRSGATGIWQFMENSMAPLLKKDSWYDERRDPWKATDAALAKLQQNYKEFGDWALALAAYNCGAGAMARVLKKNPDKDFWQLSKDGLLPKQSIQYVPKLIAISDIIENADYYELDDILEAANLIEGKEVEEYDYVTTTAMLSFNQISEATGIEKTEIKTLNQALFRNCTPARETYELRLPKGTGEEAEKKFKDLGIATDAIIYTVKKGDSLWKISRQYGITVNDICVVNGIKENGVLSIGKRLIVPIFN